MKIHRVTAAVPTALLALGLMVAVQTGCGSRTDEPAPVAELETELATATPEIVQKALAVASDLEATPDAADEVLVRHGLDLESFEELMYRMSSDPQLAKAYTAGLSRIED